MNAVKPIILYEGKYKKRDLEDFKKQKIWRVVDIYQNQLKELFEIRYPSLKHGPRYQKLLKAFIHKNNKDKKKQGNWVYFPWNGFMVHMVGQEVYEEIRTNRNKNLITTKEQQILREFTVGIAGLSVGSNIALSFSNIGMCNVMKLADHDLLETSNLNRIRATVYELGYPKVQVIAQQIYQINPYASLTLYEEGLTKANLYRFLSFPKLRLVFEIIDSFELKIHLRMEAKKLGIPVIMLANLGDAILIDIERYDQDNNIELFNGILGSLPKQILSNPAASPHQYAIDIVGKQNIPKRAIESVRMINNTLVGRPQLSSTITAASGIATLLTRKIALGKKVPSGRRIIKLNKICDLEEDLDV